MEIDIQFVSYNGGGGGGTLTRVGDFLLLNAPSFGSAIRTIEIYPRLEHIGPPLKTLGGMLKSYRKELKTLPKIWRRGNGLFVIAYLSKLGSDKSLVDDQTVSLRLFHKGCREFVSVVSMLRERLKPTDDFDFDAFHSFLQRRLEQLPTSWSELDAALDVIAARGRKEAIAQHAAKMKRVKNTPHKYKIFNTLDFHDHCETRVPTALKRAFRLRTNQIVESFSLRIPKKIKTDFFDKLNVCAYENAGVDKWFSEMDGIASVDLLTPDLSSIYRASPAQAVKRLKEMLLEGIKFAARNDARFGEHMKTWKHLIATADQAFDYDLRKTRSHPSRRWRCDAVVRIGPDHYHYDMLVKDSKTLQTIQRHRIKSTECALPYYSGIGFSKLRWQKDDIVVLAKQGHEVARFKTNLSA